MSAFQYITPFAGYPEFGDWFEQYNGPVLTKLNSIYLSRPNAGDGVTLGYNSTSGGYTFELSGNVLKNMVFSGDVVFNGTVSLASAQLSGVAFGISGNYIGVGVTAGKVVRVVNSGGITLAQADTAENSETLGIAISVDANKTIVAVAGKISGSVLANNLVTGGFSAGCVYFLDPANPGKVTKTEPNTIGQVSKPILLGLSGSEAALLPYRGQYINGICGSSGELSFNSTLYVTVKSKGETETNFKLRPGSLIANDITCPTSTTCYDGLDDTSSYYKATNETSVQNILGLVGSYVGSYSTTNGDNVTLKVYPTSSVITDVTSLNDWGSFSSGIVYLAPNGIPTSSSSFVPQVIIGNVSNSDLVLNIQASLLPLGILPAGQSNSVSSRNILINGSHHLWQRTRGVTAPYGITTSAGEIKKHYLADKFIMWAGSNTTGFTAMRQSFPNNQLDVLGYPKYYVTMKKTSVASSKSYYYSVIDDVRTIANKELTFSFYARTPGPTATFRIHGIQNVSLSPSGNTYINGTTYSTITTANQNWKRYSVTFVGNTAYSGITNSYSLLGVELVDEGKTYDFAQFILNDGATAITPSFVDPQEEYHRAASYYQRSYNPDENNGSSLFGVNNGINQIIPPLGNRIFHTFRVPMKNIPTVSIYSVAGKSGEFSLVYQGAYFDVSNPIVLNLPAYASCVRSSLLPFTTTYISAISASYTDFYFIPSQNYCSFDDIAFHYIADGDTTIN